MKKIGRYWEKNTLVHCALCPHKCRIKEGNHGKCGVRRNEKGTLYSLIYSACSSATPDPIEKKPLYHFYPGSLALSLGSVGCNLHCAHCQNYTIAQKKPEDILLHDISPEDAIIRAKKLNCDGISWTYNEPTIWWEYTFDTAQMAKKENLFTSYVTNGFINEEPLREIAPYLDAANIDIKAMNNDFYKKICGGTLNPVLDTCVLAQELGIHIEITYLIIPGHNDSVNELKKLCDWVMANLGAEIAVHFSAFFPHYKMSQVPTTTLEKLKEAYQVGKKVGLKYVYLGNAPHGDYENTYCPNCKKLLIQRIGFSVNEKLINNGQCGYCGEKVPIITNNATKI